MRTFYRHGDSLTQLEMMHVLGRFLPKGKRVRGPVQAMQLFTALYNALPNLIEHEVNRHRGLAFDSGEAGFSHQRIGG